MGCKISGFTFDGPYNINSAPLKDKQGVYAVLKGSDTEDSGNFLYIGRSDSNVKTRIAGHSRIPEWTRLGATHIAVRYDNDSDNRQREELEVTLIQAKRPCMNIHHT